MSFHSHLLGEGGIEFPFLGFADFAGDKYLSIAQTSANSSMLEIGVFVHLFIPNSTISGQVIFESGPGNDKFFIHTTSIGFAVFNGAGAGSLVSPSVQGAFHKCVIGMGGGIIHIWIDGALVATGSTSTSPFVSTSPWMLGSRSGAAGFGGMAGNFAILPRFPTADDAANYQDGELPEDIVQAHPLAANGNDIGPDANHATSTAPPIYQSF